MNVVIRVGRLPLGFTWFWESPRVTAKWQLNVTPGRYTPETGLWKRYLKWRSTLSSAQTRS